MMDAETARFGMWVDNPVLRNFTSERLPVGHAAPSNGCGTPSS